MRDALYRSTSSFTSLFTESSSEFESVRASLSLDLYGTRFVVVGSVCCGGGEGASRDWESDGVILAAGLGLRVGLGLSLPWSRVPVGLGLDDGAGAGVFFLLLLLCCC